MKAHRILAPLIRFFFRIKVIGLENIPAEAPVMFCSNHIAAKDPVMIGVACNRQITFLAKKELFSVPILGFIIKKFEAVKLDRSGTDISAIRTSTNVLANGGALAIFPQGHRYPGVNPATTKTKNGAALIAYRSGADIVPVCIKLKNYKYSFLCKKLIIFGKPIKNSELEFKNGGSEEYKNATDIIFAKILELGGYDALPCADSEEKNS